MVGFELGHGYDKIRVQEGFRKVKFLEFRSASPGWNQLDIIHVEVDKSIRQRTDIIL